MMTLCEICGLPIRDGASRHIFLDGEQAHLMCAFGDEDFSDNEPEEE